jgi:hypothetical protein
VQVPTATFLFFLRAQAIPFLFLSHHVCKCFRFLHVLSFSVLLSRARASRRRLLRYDGVKAVLGDVILACAMAATTLELCLDT